MANDVTVRVAADSSAAVTGLQKAKNAVGDFKKSTESSFASIGSKFAAMFAAVAGFGAIKALADEFGDLADQADKFGESTASVQRVSYAAEQAGASFDTVAKAMLKANANAIFAIEGNEELKKAFQSLGITAEQFIDLHMEEKLVMLAKGYEEGGSQAEKLDAVMKVLGKSGAELSVLLGQGGDALAQSLADAAVNSESTVRSIAAAGDLVEGTFRNIKVVVVESLASIVGFFEKASIKFFKFVTLAQNLGKGLTAAIREANEYEQFALKQLEADRQGGAGGKQATDIDAIREAAEEKAKAADAEKKATDELVKLKEQNDAKEEAARLKLLSLKERELEILNQIESLQDKSTQSALEEEQVRARLLDLEAELTANRETQQKDADKDAEESKREKENEIKNSQRAEKEKKSQSLEETVGLEEEKLRKLEQGRTSFSIDSLRAIGGGLADVNYGAIGTRADKEQQAIDLQKQALAVAEKQLEAIKKNGSGGPLLGDGSFN